MNLGIAVIALVLAGYALFLVLRLQAILQDAMGDEEEAGDEPQELWLSDGEFFAADKAALADACQSAVAFCTYEGVPCAVVPGQGVVSLHKLLSAKVQVVK